MHTIELPDDQFKKLSDQAAAAGFQDVTAYLGALVEDAEFDPRCGMSDDELRESAAECNRINEAMKAGGGRDAREALSELGEKLGFKTPT